LEYYVGIGIWTAIDEAVRMHTIAFVYITSPVVLTIYLLFLSGLGHLCHEAETKGIEARIYFEELGWVIERFG
jgi:hypothetical protein